MYDEHINGDFSKVFMPSWWDARVFKYHSSKVIQLNTDVC